MLHLQNFQSNNGLSVLYEAYRKSIKISFTANHIKPIDEVIKYNALFAEFLGWVQDKNNPEIYETPFTWEESGVIAFMAQRNDFSIRNMDFTTDLNWIDLVIDKLERIGCIIRYGKVNKSRYFEIIINTDSAIRPIIIASDGLRSNLLIEACYYTVLYMKGTNYEFTYFFRWE